MKRAILSFIKELKEFKEDTTNWFNEIKENGLNGTKCLSEAQENTNVMLMKMMRTVQDASVRR